MAGNVGSLCSCDRWAQPPCWPSERHREDQAEPNQRLLVHQCYSTGGDTELQGQEGEGRYSARVTGVVVQSPNLDPGTWFF